jgi:hypothetical protein
MQLAQQLIFTWLTGVWRLVPYVSRPTKGNAPVKINLLSASHK